MAGNEQHAEMLWGRYPEAVSVECNGDGGWAEVTYPGGHKTSAKCPGCEREQLAYVVGRSLPPRFRDPIVLPQPIVDWVAKGHDAEGLYLTGQVGTGKTHTAWAALAAWCVTTGTRPHGADYDEMTRRRYGPNVIFTRMTDLLDDLRPGDSARERVRDCQNAKLLGLDDVGAEKPSEWTQERLYSVIDHRYANCLPLIVTSNLPPAKLAEQTGERAASRLAEICAVVPMTGSDRRKPAA